MENAKIRKYLGMLHHAAGPDHRALVENQILDAGFTISDCYHKMEMDEPYVECQRISGVPSLNAPEHRHGFAELVCCLSGFGGTFQVGQERFRIQRGDIIIIPSGVPHGFQQEEPGTGSGVLLWLSETFIRFMHQQFPGLAAQHHFPQGGGVLRTAGTGWEILPELFRSIAGESEDRAYGWEAAVSGGITLLLSQIGRASLDLGLITRAGEKQPLLDGILAYVETKLSGKITLEDTANRFWVSQSTITHLFHEKMGVSFYKYVTRRRLSEAKILIREGMALEKVAARVGFGDYSAFFRAFKSEFGVSPREFRNQTWEE